MNMLLGSLDFSNLLSDINAQAAETTSNTETDADTGNAWQSYLEDDTLYVGRIWTDKSVYDDTYEFTTGTLGDSNKAIDKGDSDFLVALSALSSTSTEVIQSSVEGYLDVVLVLDVSGSMSQNSSGSTTRIAALKSAVNEFLTQLAQKNTSGNYRVSVVQYAGDIGGNGTEILNCSNTYSTSSTSSGGNRPGGGSSTSETVGTTKIVWDYTSITEDNLSTYTTIINGLTASGPSTAADYGMQVAQWVMEGKTDGTYTANGSTTLAGGGIRDNAESVVVMFTDGIPNYMDPTDSFDESRATGAIEIANYMKNTLGSTVYSIGLDSDADASDTKTNFNRYLNALSSNYPLASSYDEIGSIATDENGKAIDPDTYYKAVTDASDLGDIFTSIADDIELDEQSSGSPTHIEDGFHMDESGYVTFTDELGEYMYVDSVKSIVYDHNIYYFKASETNASGGEEIYGCGSSKVTNTETTGDVTLTTTTYTFTHSVIANDMEGADETDLDNIIIEVVSSNDPATGDVITVKIPASLIPLREFEIDIDEEGNLTGSITNDACPIRVFYGVSVKEGILEDVIDSNGNVTQLAAIKDPDEALQSYIASHTNENGEVYFYSNYWSGDENNGNTTAVFTPSTTNKFYYFGEDIQIFKDSDCTDPLTSTDTIDADTKYYYQRIYYKYTENTDGTYTVTQETVTREFSGADFADDGGSDYFEIIDGNVWMLAESPRLTRVNETHRLKDVEDDGTTERNGNVTETAAYANNPTWDNTANATEVSIYLGNNGRISTEIPGKLSVTKTIELYTYDDVDYPTDYEDEEFEFTVAFIASDSSDIENTYYYIITDENRNILDENGDVLESGTYLRTLTLTDGYGTITLKHGQTALIYGIADGVSYTVTENLTEDQAKNYTSTSNNAAGTIESNETSSAEFSNAYSFTSVVVENLFQVQKTIFGDDGNEIETIDAPWTSVTSQDYWFRFVLEAVSNTAGVNLEDTLPEGNVVELTNGHYGIPVNIYDKEVYNFGSVTYTVPGVYEYDVWERLPITSGSGTYAGDAIPGVSYSQALYRITVTVEPNEDGELVANKAITLVDDDTGETVNVDYNDDTMVITNTYNQDEEDVAFRGIKIYTDN
ncbi:MAG: VWA domain-containing protein [Ruminococcus sp.]|nr:VWA domain-containing protein [Ruminococcus sp.]